MLWVLLCAGQAYAQTANGTVTGIISDPSQAPVPSAKITATNPATGVHTQSETSGAGVYRISVPPGQYELSVEAAGFKTAVRQNIEIIVNETLRLDIALEVGALSEKVTVTAEAPLLQSDTSDLRKVRKKNFHSGLGQSQA
jgi:hypothetical protein